MARKKILFLSDAVSCTSGLGRITRDLASRVHQYMSDVFDVASVGYGGTGSVSIPWKEYHVHDVTNWLVPELPAIWHDFVGEEEGVLCCVWDLSRLYWLGIPQTCPTPFLRRWVETAKMKKWAYHAIDAEGPNGKLSTRIAQTMKGFDRVLDYSAFSSKITGNPDHLPHGIDSTVFYPRDHKEARAGFMNGGFIGLKPDSLLIGIVATNQARKNWQLGMETCRILLDRGHDVRLWAHTDVLTRYWDIGTLVADYGLQGRVAVTNNRFSDDQMAWMYSACDVTLGIGPEGFGYPIAESLACGVPCICGSYGAQAEFVPSWMQVEPVAYFHEGAFCSKRPVHDAEDWASQVTYLINLRDRKSYPAPVVNMDSCWTNPSLLVEFPTPEVCLPAKIDWQKGVLWPAWEKWFRGGL